MLKKSKVVALLAVCVMMFAVVEPACAETWGEWFSNLFGLGGNNVPQKGGYYKDIIRTVPGMEAHHIIPDAVSPITRRNGPAVLMTPEDHKRTASYGNSLEAQKFREQISELSKQPFWKNPNKWDQIWDLTAVEDFQQFDGKYDSALQEAKAKYDWETMKLDLNEAISYGEMIMEELGW